jgi:hypothetical protein
MVSVFKYTGSNRGVAMSTLIVSFQDLKDRLAFENRPIWEMKSLLERQGVLTELVTPFNEFLPENRFKRALWKMLYSLSRINGFSMCYVLLLVLMAREVYFQIRIYWKDFNSIVAYDTITAYAAALASNNRIPVYLMSPYSPTPWKEFISADGLSRQSLGSKLLRHTLPYILRHRWLNITTLAAISPPEIIPAYHFSQAG